MITKQMLEESRDKLIRTGSGVLNWCDTKYYDKDPSITAEGDLTDEINKMFQILIDNLENEN